LGIARQKKMHGGGTHFTPLSETLFNMGRGKIGAAGVFSFDFIQRRPRSKRKRRPNPEDRDRRLFVPGMPIRAIPRRTQAARKFV
jgi:hypothetical protein